VAPWQSPPGARATSVAAHDVARVVLASSCGESSEWLEGVLDLTEIGSRHETAADSLLGGLAQQIG
jgi:hypothetical protein